jgi:putative transposase
MQPPKSTSRGIIRIRRRQLPHWTMNGATYFVTFRLRREKLTVDETKLILGHVCAGDGRFYRLHAAVIMPDHVHLLLTPSKSYTLSRIMKGIKGGSAHLVNLARTHRGQVWQRESHERIVRGETEFLRKLHYVLNNPPKAGLTKDPWSYPALYINEDARQYLEHGTITGGDNLSRLSPSADGLKLSILLAIMSSHSLCIRCHLVPTLPASW